jgi:hypothetical protein
LFFGLPGKNNFFLQLFLKNIFRIVGHYSASSKGKSGLNLLIAQNDTPIFSTMKTNHSLKPLLLLLPLLLLKQSLLAQTKADVFDEKTPITWLGLDYSQAMFLGAPNEYGKAAELTNEQISHNYSRSWNYLFMEQPKKFNVAKAVHRASVGYKIEVTQKVDDSTKKNYFTTDPALFNTLTEQKIGDLVKNYDYQGNTGIGMLFFVDGISISNSQEGAWVTFVDMKSKTLLYTTYVIGQSGGMGFRNNWANATYKILLSFAADPVWKK